MDPAALIYSHSISPRLQYVADFLSHYYGLAFRLVYDEEKYKASPSACKINYSYHRLTADEIFIHSHALLFESAIRPVKIECFEKAHFKCFFKAEGDTGFDLFAAVFYLLSRYEEYLPSRKDSYGRYAHVNSLAFKEGFLHLPLINIWLEDFRTLLIQKNHLFSTPHLRFSLLPTYDIDMAWNFRHKGFARNAAAILLLLMKFRIGKVSQRLRVIRGKLNDPFDAYDWLNELHHRFTLHPVYFFLVAKDMGRYDRNIDIQNPEFRQLTRTHAERYQIGLHPSWASGDHPHLITSEKKALEEMAGRKITSSRQHFIRFELPSTYQKLISSGITEDYSMGYGSINGFRASVAASFYWYDLKKEESTNLLVHPFCFMDANAFYEQKSTPDAALDELKHYCNITRSVNGSMITIWHNNFLGTAPEFESWRSVYEKFITEVANGS